jgi:hypothetical protein
MYVGIINPRYAQVFENATSFNATWLLPGLPHDIAANAMWCCCRQRKIGDQAQSENEKPRECRFGQSLATDLSAMSDFT